MIVRWSLADLPDTLAEVAIRRPLHHRERAVARARAAAERRLVERGSLGRPRGAAGGRRHPRRRRRLGDRHGQVRVGPERPAGRARADDVFRRRVDDVLRHPLADRRIKGGGAGATPVAIVYDVELTFDLPQSESAGTAMNALAHCAEALYVEGHNGNADVQALAGTRIIAAALPRVVADGRDRDAREELQKGAMHAGRALSLVGARARPRDGAGARRTIRHAARRDERALPAACARVQPRPRAGGGDALRRGAARRRGRARRASWRGSAASTGSATRAFPRTSSADVAAAACGAGRQPGEPAPRLARGDRGDAALDLVSRR